MQSRRQAKRIKKVLVYLFGSLGDTIVAIPALRALRRHFSGAEIVLLQNVQSVGIVRASEVIPEGLIDRTLEYASDERGSNQISIYFHLWKKIRAEKFDAAAYLVLSERPRRSVIRDRYFFRSCGIREFIGFHAFTKEQLYPVDTTGRPSVTEHEAIRKLSRLGRDGVEILKSDDLRQPFFTFTSAEKEMLREWLQPQRKHPELPLVAIAPGCKTPANFWPTENFIRIAQEIIARKLCEIVIVGGSAETATAEKMIAEVGGGIHAAGKFSVRESAILVSMCDLYVGLDTGTTHLAAAVGTPSVTVFHQRDNPGQWFPLGSGHTLFQHEVPCAGCRLQICPVENHPCMNKISFEPVLTEVMNLLSSPAKENDADNVRVIKL